MRTDIGSELTPFASDITLAPTPHVTPPHSPLPDTGVGIDPLSTVQVTTASINNAVPPDGTILQVPIEPPVLNTQPNQATANLGWIDQGLNILASFFRK